MHKLYHIIIKYNHELILLGNKNELKINKGMFSKSI